MGSLRDGAQPSRIPMRLLTSSLQRGAFDRAEGKRRHDPALFTPPGCPRVQPTPATTHHADVEARSPRLEDVAPGDRALPPSFAGDIRNELMLDRRAHHWAQTPGGPAGLAENEHRWKYPQRPLVSATNGISDTCPLVALSRSTCVSAVGRQACRPCRARFRAPVRWHRFRDHGRSRTGVFTAFGAVDEQAAKRPFCSWTTQWPALSLPTKTMVDEELYDGGSTVLTAMSFQDRVTWCAHYRRPRI